MFNSFPVSKQSELPKAYFNIFIFETNGEEKHINPYFEYSNGKMILSLIKLDQIEAGGIELALYSLNISPII